MFPEWESSPVVSWSLATVSRCASPWILRSFQVLTIGAFVYHEICVLRKDFPACGACIRARHSPVGIQKLPSVHTNRSMHQCVETQRTFFASVRCLQCLNYEAAWCRWFWAALKMIASYSSGNRTSYQTFIGFFGVTTRIEGSSLCQYCCPHWQLFISLFPAH